MPRLSHAEVDRELRTSRPPSSKKHLAVPHCIKCGSVCLNRDHLGRCVSCQRPNPEPRGSLMEFPPHILAEAEALADED